MKLKLFFLLLILAVVGWYFISPAFDVVEADDISPLNHLSEGARDMFHTEMAKMEDHVLEMDDQMSPQASIRSTSIVAHSLFTADAHDVMGTALLIEDNGKKILRFENFETINGPNLHIYLSANLDATDFIDLGKIKATKGNVNYEVPSHVDTTKYNNVLVWCVPFRVLFSYAELH